MNAGPDAFRPPPLPPAAHAPLPEFREEAPTSKTRWPVWLALLASLLGLIAQDVALFGMAPVPITGVVYALQGMVLVIAVLLLLLANRAARNGWIE